MTEQTIEEEKIDYSKYKWSCVNDNFGKYCDGVPEWDKEPRYNGVGLFSGGTCKLNPNTCGRCKSSKELWEELPEEERDRISHPKYVENLIPIEKPKKEESEKKPKSKKAKQFEADMAQRSMF